MEGTKFVVMKFIICPYIGKRRKIRRHVGRDKNPVAIKCSIFSKGGREIQRDGESEEGEVRGEGGRRECTYRSSVDEYSHTNGHKH